MVNAVSAVEWGEDEEKICAGMVMVWCGVVAFQCPSAAESFVLID